MNRERLAEMDESPVPENRPSRASGPVTVFYSYAHEDARLRHNLENHLALLRREGSIRDWSDRDISAGEDWKIAIDNALKTAEVILLLISPDFLASDYAYEKEMKHAIARHNAGAARVVPIILRPVDWEHAPFSKLQALPSEAKPVTSWKNRDLAWKDVAQGLRRVIAELRQGRM
jgi:hypothetical protein